MNTKDLLEATSLQLRLEADLMLVEHNVVPRRLSGHVAGHGVKSKLSRSTAGKRLKLNYIEFSL